MRVEFFALKGRSRCMCALSHIAALPVEVHNVNSFLCCMQCARPRNVSRSSANIASSKFNLYLLQLLCALSTASLSFFCALVLCQSYTPFELSDAQKWQLYLLFHIATEKCNPVIPSISVVALVAGNWVKVIRWASSIRSDIKNIYYPQQKIWRNKTLLLIAKGSKKNISLFYDYLFEGMPWQEIYVPFTLPSQRRLF